MNLLLESIKMDWPVLTPIFLCSVAVVAVVIQKAMFFKSNKRNIVPYLKSLQKELARNNLDTVENMATQCGGIKPLEFLQNKKMVFHVHLIWLQRLLQENWKRT